MAKAAPTSDFQVFLEGLTNAQASTAPPPAAVASVRQVSTGLNIVINALKSAPPEGKEWFDEFVRERSEGLQPLMSAKMKQAADLAGAAENGALDPLLSRIADSTAEKLAEEFGELHDKIDGVKAAIGQTVAPSDVAAAVQKLISPELQKILDAFKALPGQLAAETAKTK